MVRSIPGCFWLAALGTLGWQGLQWLQRGYWPPVRVATCMDWLGITVPDVASDGVRMLIDWWMETPLSANLAIVGLVVSLLIAGYADRAGWRR